VSYRTLSNSTPPATPTAGKTTDFIDSSGRLSSLNSTGVLNVHTARVLSNVVRNSGFWFAQRQAPATATTYSNTTGRSISADGWGITNENASTQFARVDTQGAVETGLQGRFYGQFTKITAAGKVIVSQAIEGQEAISLRGRSVRIQAWLKSVVAASQTVKMAVVQLTAAGTIDALPGTFITAFGGGGVDPTLGTNLAYLPPRAGVSGDNCTAGTNSFSCAVTTTWQRFGGVVDVPATSKNLVIMIWSDNQLAATNGVSIAQVSLTDGFEIQDWAPCCYIDELQRVQRFFCKTFNIDVAPATNVGLNTGELKWTKVVAGATVTRSPEWRFPVRMRVAPATNTLFSPGSTVNQVRDETAGADCTGSAIVSGGESSLAVTATGAAGTTAEGLLGVHLSADAEL